MKVINNNNNENKKAVLLLLMGLQALLSNTDKSGEIINQAVYSLIFTN